MDFVTIYCKYGYYKLLLFKYRLTGFWETLPNAYKYGSFVCLTTGASVCLYKYLNRPPELVDSCDFEETAALCERRKKGIPPGLYNEENSCFLNSLLQAISASPVVAKWLKIIDVEQSKFSNLDLNVVPSLNKLLRVLSNEVGNESNYSATELINSLYTHGWVISNEQHDAFEFFQVLISTVNEEINELLARLEFQNFEKRMVPNTNIVNRISKHLPLIKNRKLNDPFKGYFANRMTCMACGYQSPVKFDAFGSLILNIQHVSKKLDCFLDSCLAKWAQPELLKDVVCQHCPKEGNSHPKRTFSKRTSLCKLPQCFCIELQRTYYSNDGSTRKNSASIKFPEFLDVTPYRYQLQNLRKRKGEPLSRPLLRGGSKTANIENRRIITNSTINWYKLISVIVHYGNAYDGHFVTYRRLPGNSNKWVYVSDQEVRLVSKEVVFDCCAYILFYEKLL